MPVWLIPGALAFLGGAAVGGLAGINLSSALKVAAAAGAVAWVWKQAR